MAKTQWRKKTLAAIETKRLADAVTWARKLRNDAVSRSWPVISDPKGIDKTGLQRLIAMERSRPNHPANWHQRAVEHAVQQPRVRALYYMIRRNLWNLPEYLTLNSKARHVLEIVIELACEEAFPYYVNVQARLVANLARMNHGSMANSLRELECLTITRPARRIDLCLKNGGTLRWPKKENSWGVNPDEPLTPIAQWVVRYRRGIPQNANCAAWWLNYDLLCGTQRVLPSFEFSIDTLPRTYEGRNWKMGRVNRSAMQKGRISDARFKVLERSLSAHGPPPPMGLRAALWEGMEIE